MLESLEYEKKRQEEEDRKKKENEDKEKLGDIMEEEE